MKQKLPPKLTVSFPQFTFQRVTDRFSFGMMWR